VTSHPGLRVTVVLFVLALGVASAQGRQSAHDWSAPAAADARPNPLSARTDTVAGGAKVFRERCAMCHGDDARGTDRGPDLSRLHVQSESDGALFWKISSGNARTGMPGFSFLPVPQRWQLVQHLRALKPASSRIR
jgi:mono/diheme cytochrome c family protein